MSEPCLEILVFKVRNVEEARIARKTAQNAVRHYHGFISWTAYESCEDRNLFADLVLWKDQKTAQDAIARIRKDPDFAALVAEMEGLVTMSSFKPESFVEAKAAAAA